MSHNTLADSAEFVILSTEWNLGYGIYTGQTSRC
jgi:hypothetical protein